MNRRRYLAAVVGAASIAGCSQGGSEPTATASSTPTETASPTSTASPTETSTATETETPTATDEPTPSPAELTQESLEEARTALNDALEEYAAAAGTANVLITDVTPSTGFSTSLIQDPMDRARTAIDEAANTATAEQEPTVEKLQGIRLWIVEIATAQELASFTDSTVGSLEDGVHRAAGDSISSTGDSLGETAQSLRQQLSIAADAADPEDFEDLDVEVSTIERKQGQIERLAANYGTLSETAATLSEAITDLDKAIANYRAEDYGAASPQWSSARGACEELYETYEEFPPGSSAAATLIGNFWCAFDQLSKAIADMEVSNEEAWRYDNDYNRQQNLEDAKEDLSGCDGYLDEFDDVEELRSLR